MKRMKRMSEAYLTSGPLDEFLITYENLAPDLVRLRGRPVLLTHFRRFKHLVIEPAASIQGAQKNWMNVKGRMMNMEIVPDNSTTMEKARPRSEVKVISPNPSVDMTVNDQYTPVKAEYSRPS